MRMDASALYKMGLRIREMRKLRGMKQEELAEILEISPAQMSHIERGFREPSLQVLVTLVEFMDVTLDYVVLGRIPEHGAPGMEYLVLREMEERLMLENDLER